MKWIYIILLVAVVGGVLTSEKLRSYVFSQPSGGEAVSEEADERPTSSRLEEASGISAMHGEVAR